MSVFYRISQYFFNRTIPWVEYVMFSLLFPGGIVYSLASTYYIKYFDTKYRQKKDTGSLTNVDADWQNPKVVGRNRRKMHVYSHSFSKKSQALNYWLERSQSPIVNEIKYKDILYLTGECGIPDETKGWKFTLIGHPDQCPEGWTSRLFSDAAWYTISLPNHWQLQGYDIPIYTNTAYPFRFDPPYTVRDGTWTNTLCDLGLGSSPITFHPLNSNEPGPNATGLFRYSFILPEEWKPNDSFYFLTFEGVDSSLEVYLNETLIGYSQDSCLSVEFDISRFITTGPNLLAVKVTRWCDGSYLEDQDKWWLSGIYREVYVTKKPSAFVSDIEFISTTIDENLNKFSLEINVQTEGVVTKDCVFQAELYAYPDLSIPIFTSLSVLGPESSFLSKSTADRIISSDGADVDISSPINPRYGSIKGLVESPNLWTAETPTLYLLVITLYSSQEDAANRQSDGIHTESHRVGFRKVEIGGENNSLNINNRPVIIAGMNRHEFDCKTGRAVSRISMINDAIILKSLNFNAVRSAHYPQHPYWLEICDEVGLYVIDEANIETHGFQTFGQPVGYLSNLIDWRGSMASRVCRMYERDKLHAAVIGWSLGNESGHGPTHDLLADWLRARDNTRFVQYESGGARTTATDIICPMYLRPDWCINQSLNDSKKRPVILCEYAHAMGNSGGCLHKYWKLFYDKNFPRFQGGFIWDFADQGLLVDNTGFKYGGDFGDFPNTHHFCCNGILAPDRSPYPTVHEVAFLQSPVELAFNEITSTAHSISCELLVRNRRIFTDLSDLVLNCSLKTQLGLFGKAIELGCFSIQPSHILPGESETLNVTEFILSLLQSNFLLANETSYNADDVNSCWLEVSVMKIAKTSHWNKDQFVDNGKDYELSHHFFESSGLLKFVTSLISRQPIIPRADSFSVLITNHPNQQISLAIASNSKVTLDLKEGLIVHWEIDLLQVLSRPLDVCVYRAPTDNDVGGGDLSYAARWKAAGYNNMMKLPGSVKMLNLDITNDSFKSAKFSWVIVPRGENANGVSIPVEASYLFRNDGTIEVDFTITPAEYLPTLPRFGAKFAISDRFDNVQWFGLGPHEAYDDRKSGVYLGVFEKHVSDMHTTYICPQENGRRADVRWAKFTGVSLSPAIGILMNPGASKVGYGLNVSKYSLEELESKKHDYELVTEADNCSFVHVDSYTMGVAGYDSWSPNVDPEYQFKPNGTSISTKFKLFSNTY